MKISIVYTKMMESPNNMHDRATIQFPVSIDPQRTNGGKTMNNSFPALSLLQARLDKALFALVGTVLLARGGR